MTKKAKSKKYINSKIHKTQSLFYQTKHSLHCGIKNKQDGVQK